MSWLLLIVGFIFLIKGADLFVDGASSIARKLNVSSLVIGMTIVAFGTSAPEAAVSISAAVTGDNEIALGNVIGSNIFNLLVVVGVSAIFKPVLVDRPVLKRDYPYNLFATALVILLSLSFAKSGLCGTVGRVDGFILLVFFVIFMTYTIYYAFKEKTTDSDNIVKKPVLYSIIICIIGILAIVFGGTWVVDAASDIAEGFGVSQTVIGLTIVAIGTSLPELVTSIVAAAKGESDIAIGNVIGSNIFNLLFILGMSTAIHPISVDVFALSDIAFLMAVSLIVYMLMSKRKKITA